MLERWQERLFGGEYSVSRISGVGKEELEQEQAEVGIEIRGSWQDYVNADTTGTIWSRRLVEAD